MFKKIIFFFSTSIIFFIFIYFGIGFYIAHSILRIDHSCGSHEGSLPNTWLTSNDSQDYKVFEKKILRKNFLSSNYHLDKWEDIYFPSRDKQISINGWLFNYHPNKPIVIVVHGIFPNGKCKPESNLIASLLIKNEINVLTIDLRNYGQSTRVGNYENLGLSEYKDVLGAYDYLQTLGFKKQQIGLLGISLGSTSVIFAAEKESDIKAVWLESSLAEFKMILKDEISRYGLPHDFGLAVSFAGRLLTGIDPTKLNPAFSLTPKQNYFFTHGDKDLRVLPRHFLFLKDYATINNINADFWFIKNAYHVDGMLMFPEEYGKKMKIFFEKNLSK